jgi:hypothetical protein
MIDHDSDIYFIDNVQHNMEDWRKIWNMKKIFWKTIHKRHKQNIKKEILEKALTK